MELDLLELYVLLNIHERKGYLIINNFSYGLGAVALLELAIQSKIKLDDSSKLIVLNNRRIGNDVLDKIFDKIKNSDNPKRLSKWIFKISYKASGYKKEILKKLERKKIIHIEQRYFLRIIPYKRYPILNRQLRKSVLLHLHEVINGSNPEKNIFMQYAMVYSSGLTAVLFKAKVRKEALKRFEELLEKAKIDQQIKGIIKSIRKTIKIHTRNQI